ncbi:DUF4361 domain-containing protein [Bacteroides salyersiae]|uniref:BT_3044 domain-containing protein n=1 Tax=Bacteroides salyersiae TaxID=291644 RepID=UPI001CCA0A2E|nr:DUF4361 domain-containing protein [Bacteroides salyersiae]UBD66233.1 DUF4361 domain-containing protein [Bacteroides salyersiae]
MKTSRILLAVGITCCMAACNEDAQFDKELYKKVVNVLSDEKLVFSVNHDLNKEESTGYISIGCGGTKHIETDVLVELEPDGEAMAKYNKLNFDIDESKFAHALESWRYNIPDMTTVLKVDNEDNYATIPVHVRPEGLSPDSIYLIPLRIKSVSAYEINPDKRTVLYRVLLKNNYAFQSPSTTYNTVGMDVRYREDGVEIDRYNSFSLTRPVVPLTKNSIRCFAGMNTYDLSNLALGDIQRYAIRITINEDATLTVTPIGTVQVEMLNNDESNFYVESTTSLDKIQKFYLNYRYRVLKDGCDGSNGDADYDVWHDIEETMTKKEPLINS